MAVVALALFGLYFAVAFGLRTWLQYRRTGDSGFRGLSGSAGTLEWWAGVLFVLALIAGVAGPVAGLVGLSPIDGLDAPWIRAVGITLTLAGIAATFAAQVSMGNSWRIGVDAEERTGLVTGGAFSLVRNPIFTAMAITAFGLVLIVANVVAIVGLIGLLIALQMQVRAVEEPYLARLHGSAWTVYAGRVGRFLPGIGTISTVESSGSLEGNL